MSETDSELNARSLKEILSLTSTLRSGYEKLVAENDKLRAALDWYLEWYTKERAMSDELHLPPEIESLRQAYLSALRGWTGEIERLRTEAARLSAENEQFRVQDETIRAEVAAEIREAAKASPYAAGRTQEFIYGLQDGYEAAAQIAIRKLGEK